MLVGNGLIWDTDNQWVDAIMVLNGWDQLWEMLWFHVRRILASGSVHVIN